uniref:Amine oxidase domain-containing protein n=1 Tax=Leersia perrieri TaxID=77586 RepID=A0A0D9XJ20_9ORYZ
MKLSMVIALALLIAQYASLAVAAGPKVIIVGAGMSGISAGKRLSDAGINDFLILEATDRIGGRIHKTNFAGVNVEMGANWVEGVGGKEMNPIWTMVKDELNLRNFNSDYDHLSNNTYKENGGLYDEAFVQKTIDRADEVEESGNKLSGTLHVSGREDMSVMAMQRLNDHMPSGPSTPVDMVIDYYKYDYEFAEPPRVTSLQNTQPLPTFNNFGDEVHFVADQRGYESVVYLVAGKYLKTDKSGAIVVREITYFPSGVMVKTEDGQIYEADYVMVSVSLGVLQTDLIRFKPQLPSWKIVSIYQFDMSVYTKIFLNFPQRFWPEGPGTEFFLYASGRRGYYPVWQQFEKQYSGSNVLLVTVTDDESRRIEQQSDNQTKAEAVEVLRKMFPGKFVPDATDILVPRWWSNRFFKGTFSNWPIGVNRYEYDQIRAPVGRVYFTGEHTSEHYNGYVHGAYLAVRSLFNGNVVGRRASKARLGQLDGIQNLTAPLLALGWPVGSSSARIVTPPPRHGRLLDGVALDDAEDPTIAKVVVVLPDAKRLLEKIVKEGGFMHTVDVVVIYQSSDSDCYTCSQL